MHTNQLWHSAGRCSPRDGVSHPKSFQTFLGPQRAGQTFCGNVQVSPMHWLKKVQGKSRHWGRKFLGLLGICCSAFLSRESSTEDLESMRLEMALKIMRTGSSEASWHTAGWEAACISSEGPRVSWDSGQWVPVQKLSSCAMEGTATVGPEYCLACGSSLLTECFDLHQAVYRRQYFVVCKQIELLLSWSTIGQCPTAEHHTSSAIIFLLP